MTKTYKSTGFAALAPLEKLKPHTYDVKDISANEVKIRVLYCGVCHSDLHQVKNDWKVATFPIVPGHEIIGEIVEVGSNVKNHVKGEKVGIGCMVDSCGNCKSCSRGTEQFCPKSTFTYASSFHKECEYPTYGGYGQYVTANQNFIIKIPDNIDLPSTAPLLCAGITVYSPMVKHNLNRPGLKIAVIGLGGLGHMAVKFAVAWGCEVTVITRSEFKKQDALNFGAVNFIASNNPSNLDPVKYQFDGIVDTVSAERDAQLLLDLLHPEGVMICVGAPPVTATSIFIQTSLITGAKTIAGSLIGGIAQTQEMINFCSSKGISATIELIKFDQINECYERMEKGDVKYRFVIDINESLKSI